MLAHIPSVFVFCITIYCTLFGLFGIIPPFGVFLYSTHVGFACFPPFFFSSFLCEIIRFGRSRRMIQDKMTSFQLFTFSRFPIT